MYVKVQDLDCKTYLGHSCSLVYGLGLGTIISVNPNCVSTWPSPLSRSSLSHDQDSINFHMNNYYSFFFLINQYCNLNSLIFNLIAKKMLIFTDQAWLELLQPSLHITFFFFQLRYVQYPPPKRQKKVQVSRLNFKQTEPHWGHLIKIGTLKQR